MVSGVIMGLCASACWAFANVFISRSSRAVGPFRALVWAQVLGGLALAPIALAMDHRTAQIDTSVVGWGVVAGLTAVLAYACLFFSAEGGQLSVVVPVMSSWSVVAAGVSIGVLGESVRRTHLIGAGLVVSGVLMVSRYSQPPRGASRAGPAGGGVPGAPGTSGAPTDQEGPRVRRRARHALLAAVGAAFGFGILIPAMDRLAPVLGRLGEIPVVFSMDLLLGVPLALAARVKLSFPPRRAWGIVAAAGLFETAGFVWISLGASRAPVAVVSPLASLASALTVLFAWAVLRERPAGLVLAGAAVACAGVVTLAL